MIHRNRLTAKFTGNFVVFLIGMRVNEPLKIRTWLPFMQAMPKMIKELKNQPETGFLHAEIWYSRTSIMLQYWRSIEELNAYLQNTQSTDLPAWSTFSQADNSDGVVGVWQEAYIASPGRYDTIYVNMPPFGLGAVAALTPATSLGHKYAAQRMQHKIK